MQNKKYEKQITDLEYQVIKLEKMQKEMLEEKDSLLARAHESETKRD